MNIFTHKIIFGLLANIHFFYISLTLGSCFILNYNKFFNINNKNHIIEKIFLYSLFSCILTGIILGVELKNSWAIFWKIIKKKFEYQLMSGKVLLILILILSYFKRFIEILFLLTVFILPNIQIAAYMQGQHWIHKYIHIILSSCLTGIIVFYNKSLKKIGLIISFLFLLTSHFKIIHIHEKQPEKFSAMKLINNTEYKSIFINKKILPLKNFKNKPSNPLICALAFYLMIICWLMTIAFLVTNIFKSVIKITPFFANLSGWILAEYGRKPWIIYNKLLSNNAYTNNNNYAHIIIAIIIFIVSLYYIKQEYEKFSERR